MKGRFRQNGLTGEQRLRDLLGHTHGPFVMHVPAAGKRNQKPGIRDASHFFENPLWVERSRLPPRILPARRINFFDELSRDRARSKCCRTSSPCEIPVRAEVSSIHVARFFGKRIVNVSPIWQECVTLSNAVKSKQEIAANVPGWSHNAVDLS
jgi:hypothetical protein